MTKIIKNFPVVLHQLFFLFAQLLILYTYGIGYSGTLAYIGVVSAFLAVLINLRWDIEIMVSNSQVIYKSIFDASLTIILMAGAILLFNIIIGTLIPLYIILAAIFISIHELLVSILFVQRKIYIYSFYRTLPALALILLAFIGFGPEIIWTVSFLFSALCLLIYFKSLLNKAFKEISLKRIQSINLRHKFNAAITASAFSFFSALFVIVINHYYGDDYVGLWSNTIRIFNSLIIFLLGACLPFILNMIREKRSYSEKIKKFFYLWILLSPLIILSLFVVSNFGLYIFSFFEIFDLDVTNVELSYIFIIGVLISFIGSSQGLYQSINKSIFLFCIIMLAFFTGFLMIYDEVLTFNAILKIFIYLLSFLTIMILVNLITYLIFKTNNLKS